MPKYWFEIHLTHIEDVYHQLTEFLKTQVIFYMVNCFEMNFSDRQEVQWYPLSSVTVGDI